MMTPLLHALGLLLIAPPLQEPRSIPETPQCGRCQIVVGPRRLTITDTSATATELSGLLAVTSRGYYLAAARAGPPQVFDASGRFVRALGRQGSGPREFRATTAFVTGPGDSLAVFDGPNARIQIFDHHLTFVREFPAQQAVLHGGMLWRPDTVPFVVSGLRPSPSEIGYTLHLYTGDGSYRGSMAESDVPVVPTTSRLAWFRLLHAPAPGRIVSVSVAVLERGYTIEGVNPATGTVTERWRRTSRWFEAEPGPFPSRVLSAWTDSTGLLWTMSAARQPDWEKHAKTVTIGRGRNAKTAYTKSDRHLLADTLIEVVDLRAGALVAQARFDKVYLFRLENGLLAAERDDQWGFDLFPVTLTRP